MNPADRIKQARIQLGLAPEQVAGLLGITTPHYYDLEGHDDELTSTLAIDQALRLAAILHTSLSFLLWGEAGPEARPFAELAAKIEAGLNQGSFSSEELPWRHEPLFKQGAAGVLGQPIDFVKDLATFVGDDWRPFIVFLAESPLEN